MRNKIFILTEDLTFFYRVNKELNRFNIPFNVLNKGNKIPFYPSIILTTSEEYNKFDKLNEKMVFILYNNKDHNFDDYILKLISAYRIGYKKNYSDLIFSVDPGQKTGLMVFLDDYYLISSCCFGQKELIKKIEFYVNHFQKENPIIIKLTFKFGRGVFSTTQHLIKEIYNIFNKRINMSIFLIDESKSSKIKVIREKREKKISKDEVSALILALRDGVEVTQTNFETAFNHIKSTKMKKQKEKSKKIENSRKKIDFLREIAEKILNGYLSLTESIALIKENNINTFHDNQNI